MESEYNLFQNLAGLVCRPVLWSLEGLLVLYCVVVDVPARLLARLR